MKKLLFMCLLGVVSTLSFAQLENIKINNDSTIIINELYAGMLSGSMFSTDSLSVDKIVDLRFGMCAEWKIVNTLSVKGMAMFSTDLSSDSWGLQQVEIDWMPNKKHLFQIGNMGTISTEQRPGPVTGNGQFETWTEAQIPGQALGMKYTFKPNNNWLIGTGVALRDNKPEYHGKIEVKAFTLSGYYRISEDNGGLAFTYKCDRIYNTFVWKNTEVFANIFSFKLVPKSNINFYADLGYDLKKKDLVRCETGFLKKFSSKYAKGLWGVGYKYQPKALIPEKSVNVYLFIHL